VAWQQSCDKSRRQAIVHASVLFSETLPILFAVSDQPVLRRKGAKLRFGSRKADAHQTAKTGRWWCQTARR
jgi:hypothetical protein